MNDPIDSKRYYVQHYHDVRACVFVDNESNQSEKKIGFLKSFSQRLTCWQFSSKQAQFSRVALQSVQGGCRPLTRFADWGNV
jgi:hypothetical protein